MVNAGRDWLDDVRTLPPDRIFVEHNPPTPRYGRALSKLSYVIREAVYLGARPADGGRLEVAAWARHPTGRDYGYYCCFRLFFGQGGLSSVVMFCFYNGTERSRGFKSIASAIEYAAANGFKVDQ